MRRGSRNIDEILRQSLPSASKDSKDEIESLGTRTLQRLQGSKGIDEDSAGVEIPRLSAWRRLAIIPTAAAVILGVFIAITWRQDALAVLEKVDGTLYRVVDGNTRRLHVGETIDVGTPVRTEDRSGAVLKLPDGARVEMHEKSEISLEHTNDGTRIRLSTGSVNITPSKQPGGNLYVQNREVTVPVIGALFQDAGAQKPAEPQLAFEVASIRPRSDAPTIPGARGGAGPAGPEGCGSPGMPQVDAARFAISNIALPGLISMAHSDWFGPRGGCMGAGKAGLLSGGPGWVRSDQWDIQAKVPEGTPAYTGSEFWEGGAPEIHRMLQTLLKERFKLVLRRETREMPVYLLKVSKNGAKFNGHGQLYARSVILDGDGKLKKRSEMPPLTGDKGTWGMVGSGLLDAENLSMTEWTTVLFTLTGRTVLDRTGLSGRYDFNLEFDRRNDANGSNLMDAMREQIGLELEEAKAPVEVWVIEHAEKPSEN